ncbi:MAG TPA: thiamine pyrophosphate-dependent dehydrogenase E1 component subunit alpha [Ktedonobacteraceae bacterium]|nr:thiamine pyrophosphate-dependent dehydrogenase E1 component subunit alpha [Ktedonobacteraceae bacterium]
MLLTRLVDECAWHLHTQGHIQFVASCRGHEAAQVASALCIAVGKDFTLPYYRDLGVVLTIGMTPHEVLRTYLHLSSTEPCSGSQPPLLHWGYHKHNMVTGPAPVATQILHAAGIAFACKLRKTDAVTVAYCDDSATAEADFLEGVRFAALHQLPMIIICEQDCPANPLSSPSPLRQISSLELPEGLTIQQVDGSDFLAVYEAMSAAMAHARTGRGPLLLELFVTRSLPPSSSEKDAELSELEADPLLRCVEYMRRNGLWDEAWAHQLQDRLATEVASALQDALRESSPDIQSA